MVRIVGILGAIVLGAGSASGAEVEGFACVTSKKLVGFQPADESKCLPATFEDDVAREDFITLKPGDYALVTGVAKSNSITIDTVEAVGLRRLIGLWRDNRSRYLQFENFYQFWIYDANKSSPPKAEALEFELYPNSRDSWLMITVQGSKAQAASLREVKVRPATFELCIFESQASRAKDCVTLTRISN